MLTLTISQLFNLKFNTRLYLIAYFKEGQHTNNINSTQNTLRHFQDAVSLKCTSKASSGQDPEFKAALGGGFSEG